MAELDGSKPPTVSIIMPAYNAAATIGMAIQSVIDQTFTDWELIVVDDCSKDETVGAVRSFSDPRIHLIELTRNMRPSAARNKGLAHARGVWFAGLDADDQWVPERLSKLLSCADDGYFVTDVCAPAVPDATGHLVPLKKRFSPSSEMLHDLIDLSSFMTFPGVKFPLFPLAHIRKANIVFPEAGSGGDWAFVIARCFHSGLKCRLLLWPGLLTRVTGDHDSSTLKAIEEQFAVDLELSEAPWIPEDAKRLIANGLVATRRRLLVAALREGKLSTFVRYAGRHPWDVIHLPLSAAQFIARRARQKAVRSQ